MYAALDSTEVYAMKHACYITLNVSSVFYSTEVYAAEHPVSYRTIWKD